MKSALRLWANLEAARDDSSMNLSHIKGIQIDRLGVANIRRTLKLWVLSKLGIAVSEKTPTRVACLVTADALIDRTVLGPHFPSVALRGYA